LPVKVGIFVVVMLIVAAGLVVVFGEFRFAASNRYHATFSDASRLDGGTDVRIAGVPVGTVDAVTLNADNTVDVAEQTVFLVTGELRELIDVRRSRREGSGPGRGPGEGSRTRRSPAGFP